MAWVLKIDQTRGGSVSAGTAGHGREDLWINQVVTLSAVWVGGSAPPGSHVFHFAILNAPPASTAALSSAGGTDVSSVTFTPDVVTYSYLIELMVDGGGSGRTDRRVASATYNSTGYLQNRGWRFPAVGEVTPDANFTTDAQSDRQWLRAYERMFLDMLANWGGGGGTSIVVISDTITV